MAMGMFFFGNVLGKSTKSPAFVDSVLHESVGEHVYRRFFQTGALMNVIALCCCYVLWYSEKGDKIVEMMLGKETEIRWSS